MRTFEFYKLDSDDEKLDLLEEFIKWWYGPRFADYGGAAETVQRLNLPVALRRFYEFAGRWPCRLPVKESGMDKFYTGAGFHHLLPLDGGNPVKHTKDGFIKFYMDYQGDWDILAEPQANSNRLWIRGCWDGRRGETENENDPVQELSITLTDLLISHLLACSVFEFPNNILASSRWPLDTDRLMKDSVLMWTFPRTEFPFVTGSVYQCRNMMLFKEADDGGNVLACSNPYGVLQLMALLTKDD